MSYLGTVSYRKVILRIFSSLVRPSLRKFIMNQFVLKFHLIFVKDKAILRSFCYNNNHRLGRVSSLIQACFVVLSIIFRNCDKRKL